MNPQLEEYIKQARASGMTDEQIRQALLSSGWSEDDINNTLGSNSILGPEDQEKFIKKWSWGGFVLFWLYLVASRMTKKGFLYLLGSFVPILNIYLWLKTALRGRKIVWESSKWSDFESYKKRQKLLDKIGIVLLLIGVVSFAIGIIVPVIKDKNLNTTSTPITTPTPEETTKVVRQKDCGSILDDHIIFSPQLRTTQEKDSLKCISEAIISCDLASITIPDGNKGVYGIKGKSGSNCLVSVSAEAEKIKKTCQLPNNIINDVKTEAERRGEPEEVFPVVSFLVALEEFNNTRTGEKIKISCSPI